jgi:hypothetical protein
MTTQSPVHDTAGLDPFEARLLVELRREVAGPTSVRAPVPPARRRTRRVLAATAGVAAAAIVGVVLVPGLGSSAAYSVQEGNAGEVVVEIHRPEDAAGLERALAEHGIASDVTYLSGLRTCAAGRFTEVEREVGMRLQIGDDMVKVTLSPGAVRDGETFVMVLSVEPMTGDELAEVSEREGHTALEGTTSSVSAEVATGAVGACEVVPAS